MADLPEVQMTAMAVRPDTDVETAETPPPIDPELLEEAQRQIQAASPNEAINEALRRLVLEERNKRRAAMEYLWKMHDEGRFDYSHFEAARE
ncbi:type II toxin-antitoxin system VapB family antitoxin [Actinoplanes sp. G11-F43]|uniref:type II toxin-antitoxin system VapB family antitoxin n=1 Tax=Actinoplanes sp. G11-F43 TaxID=3424130 RepID=UPI003D32BE20